MRPIDFDDNKTKAQEIIDYLKENYPNKEIPKVALRNKYRLPVNRASSIFFFMSELGATVFTRTILVPHEKPDVSDELSQTSSLEDPVVNP